MQRENLDALAESVIGAAIEVHRQLGAGLLEKVYAGALCIELQDRCLAAAKEVVLPVSYEGQVFEAAYRLDLVVADTLIVEVKAVDQLLPGHAAQLLSYLRLSGMKLGLLLNFNTPVLRDGIKRIANNL